MPDRDPLNAFASCPAATGEAGCLQFPDGAHRCGKARDHVRGPALTEADLLHRCTCGHGWSSLTGTISSLIHLLTG